MLYRAENIRFCEGLQFQELNAQKSMASRRLLALEVRMLEVKITLPEMHVHLKSQNVALELSINL
jgi:hypothetical protein